MAIKLTGVKHATFRNVTISNHEKGITIDGPTTVDADSLHFNNVVTPWDVDPQATGRIKRSRVTNDPKLAETKPNVRTGWRKLRGPALPLYCDNCHNISVARNHDFAGSYWEFWNNTEECPICGAADAKVSEGIFNLAKDAAEIISAPDITHVMFKALASSLAEIRSGRTNIADAEQKLQLIHPKLGSLLKSAWKFGQTGLVILGIAVAVYYGERADRVATAQLVASQKPDLTAPKLDLILEQLKLIYRQAANSQTLLREAPPIDRRKAKAVRRAEKAKHRKVMNPRPR